MSGYATESIDLWPSLQKLGFDNDPFASFQAERIEAEDRQLLYVEPPGIRHLDDVQSAVFLASSGGGKTSCALHLEVMLKVNKQIIVTHYDELTAVKSGSTTVRLADHYPALLSKMAETVFTLIVDQQTIFFKLPDISRNWYWAFLAAYIKGTDLVYRLDSNGQALARNYADFRSSHSPPPIYPDTTIDIALQSILSQLKAHFNIEQLWILVDCADRPTGAEADQLFKLLQPILNNPLLFTLTGVVWKFFLPTSLKDNILDLATLQTDRLALVNLDWSASSGTADSAAEVGTETAVPSLIYSLNRRLSWASNKRYTDLNKLFSLELDRRQNEVDIVQELLVLLEQSHLAFTPRSVFALTRQLFNLSSFEDGGISLDEWLQFKQAVYAQQDEKSLVNKVQIDRKRFIELLDSYLSNNDLIAVCFALNIDYDNLPGNMKRGRLIALYNKLESKSRLQELIEHLEEKRPNVKWAEVYY